MQFSIRTIVCAFFVFFLLLPAFALTSSAATITWTGGGADNLASNSANWTGNVVPNYGDGVVFDSTSVKDCTWDINETLSSIIVTPEYTGTVTQIAIFKVSNSFPPPSATTDPASNKNGDSATLNATINPNRLATSVYFEWGTDATYGNATLTQVIPAGENNIVVTANIVGLSINTTYHYRIVATNTGGTAYGSDVMFTTPPITINITSPASGSDILRPDVMVKGALTMTAGNETGVTVNGMVAMTYNNQFVANHVPLTDGANTITVTATDTAGNTATTAIVVTAVTAGNYIRLNANPEAGIAPLDTTIRIDGSFSVTNPLINATGPATVESLVSSNPEEYVYRMTVEGIYFFTASATGPDSMQYQDTAGIVVYNQSQLDTVLRSIWSAMTSKLSIGDKTGALLYMSSVTRPNYEQILNAISSQLPSMMATQQELNFIYATNNMAKYELVTLEEATLYSYEVTFIKDENGIWKILQY